MLFIGSQFQESTKHRKISPLLGELDPSADELDRSLDELEPSLEEGKTLANNGVQSKSESTILSPLERLELLLESG